MRQKLTLTLVDKHSEYPNSTC